MIGLRQPKPFRGQCVEYRKFRRSIQLRLAAYEKYLDDKSKILFILSYMEDGLAGVWAQSYMDDHTVDDRLEVGIYTDFINKLDEAFLDPNLIANAEAKLETIRQGGRTAQEFFIEFDGLRKDVQCETEWRDKDLIVHLMRALNPGLRRKLRLAKLCCAIWPETYEDYKKTALQLDALYWESRIANEARRDSGKGTAREGSSVGDREDIPDGGNMDLAKMRRRGLCFRCREHGHLARNCLKNRSVQGSDIN